MHYHLIGFNCRYSHSCLALFYLRNELERNQPGSRVTISQLTINDAYYSTLLRISASGADVLFFSVYIWNASLISRLVRDLAAVQPERPIVLGGPQAPFIGNLPENSTIVVGEIEGVGNRFYHDLEIGKLDPVYQADHGRPFSFPYREEDFATQLQNRQVYYESSRGCPFNCSYCLSSVTKGVIHKGIDQVQVELGRILQHQPRIIKFIDRTFNDNPGRALAIWQYLASCPGETMFHFEVAPDRFTDDMFSFLETVKPDRFQFEIGIQSTNGRTLEAINRQMDVDGAAANIKRLVQLDSIHLHVDLILGLPYETEETFHRSFNRVFSCQPHYIQMGLLKVLPGTAIAREAARFELVYCEQPPYQVLANLWLDHRSLSTLHAFGECVEAFYNNRYFRTLWQYLFRRGEDPYHFFQSLLACSEPYRKKDVSYTQELLTRIAHEAIAGRPDCELLKELLRYDWLRCGHRFLPGFLEGKPLADMRLELRRSLPQELDGYYTHQTRNEFFKQGIFDAMSAQALEETGLAKNGQAGIVCFYPGQTTGVIKHRHTGLLEWKR